MERGTRVRRQRDWRLARITGPAVRHVECPRVGTTRRAGHADRHAEPIMRNHSAGIHRQAKIALVDPGDFTPAYNFALASGLAETGHDVRQYGCHGFNEAVRTEFRRDHFYRPLNHPLAQSLP